MAEEREAMRAHESRQEERLQTVLMQFWNQSTPLGEHPVPQQAMIAQLWSHYLAQIPQPPVWPDQEVVSGLENDWTDTQDGWQMEVNEGSAA